MNTDALILRIKELKAIAEECLTMLGQVEPHSSRVNAPAANKRRNPLRLDFGKPIRPFMKAYAKNLSGPKKFVLLLAWLTKGDLKKQVLQSEIQKQWNRMTAILEMDFNRFFAAAAKDNDWVEAKTKGLYNLRPAWSDSIKD